MNHDVLEELDRRIRQRKPYESPAPWEEQKLRWKKLLAETLIQYLELKVVVQPRNENNIPTNK